MTQKSGQDRIHRFLATIPAFPGPTPTKAHPNRIIDLLVEMRPLGDPATFQIKPGVLVRFSAFGSTSGVGRVLLTAKPEGKKGGWWYRRRRGAQ